MVDDLLGSLLLFKIVATIVAVVVYVLVRIIRNRAIDRIARARQFHPSRVFMVRRALGIVGWIILLGVLTIIWSIDFRSLAVASGAILAALGIAFFAQWSILSNVTTSIIMYWRFPIHIGGRVGLLSDQSFSGIVTDLTPFFIVIRDDDGNIVTVPNVLSLQQAFIVYSDGAPAEGEGEKKQGSQSVPAAEPAGSLDDTESEPRRT